MGGFDIKARALPNVARALLHSSIELAGELYAVKGPGPWVDHLHGRICHHLKNESFDGLSPPEEVEQIEAALTAIDAVFSTINSKYRRIKD